MTSGFLARVKDASGLRRDAGGGLSTLRRTGILAHEFAPAEDVIAIAEAVVASSTAPGVGSAATARGSSRGRYKFGPEEFLRLYFEERKAAPILRSRWWTSRRRASPQSAPPPAGARAREFARTNVRGQRDPELVAVTVRLTLGDLTTAQFRALAEIADEFSEERELRTTVEQKRAAALLRRATSALAARGPRRAGLVKAGGRTISDVVSCPALTPAGWR